MKWLRYCLFIIVFAAVHSVFSAVGDTTYIYNDDVKDVYYPTSDVAVVDTITESGQPLGAETDTGAKLDRKYLNVDYQLANGFMAFKLLWEYGTTSFAGTMNGFQFHSFMFSFKGLLPTQKATLFWGCSDGCGDPITIDSLTTFTSSSSWKTIVFPLDSTKAARKGIREFRVIIHDTTGAQTSAKANLKIDNMAFLTYNSGIISKHSHSIPVTGSSYFTPANNGSVHMSVFSINGKLLMNKDIAVNAGKQYLTSDFATQHSSLSAAQMYLVKITGAGVNVLQQMR
jgi:hypothetical protein